MTSHNTSFFRYQYLKFLVLGISTLPCETKGLDAEVKQLSGWLQCGSYISSHHILGIINLGRLFRGLF